MASTNSSEKGIGLAILFVLLGLGGAVGMYVGSAENLVAAAGFAVAVIGGSLAIAARHVYA